MGGHAEGDRALVLVSETLKQVCERLKAQAFLGRYGGDEFTVVIRSEGEGEPPELIAEAIRNALSVKQKENGLRYDLKVSIGCEMLKDKDDTLQACLIRADEKLYQDKRNR